MSDKLERFTKRARRALTLAQEESLRLNHTYIGPEHLLLGLVREENGVAVNVLRELGVEPSQIIRAVERTVGRGERPPYGKPSLSPRSKRAIELAVDEARLMGQHYIGTEHLLLGVVHEGESVAADVLQGLGVNLDQVRTQTARNILQSQAQSKKREDDIRLKRERLDYDTRMPVHSREELKPPASLMDQLAYDLTAAADEERLGPVIGRQTEIERLIQILSRRTKNNPALIGEPGVGKTAIVEGLAQRIVEGDAPEPLLNRRLLMLDLGSLVAGATYRDQFEGRLKKVIDEITTSKALLFIDEMHMLVGAAGSSVDAATILKPALSRGELQVIVETTPDGYRRAIKRNDVLVRCFYPVLVEEPSVEETIEILRGVRSRYEEHHKLIITDDALEAAANLAARYAPDRFMPDKAIDLLDEASSYVRMHKSPYAASFREAFIALKKVQKAKEKTLAAQRYTDALDLHRQELELENRLEELRVSSDEEANKPRVTATDVNEVISTWARAFTNDILASDDPSISGDDAGDNIGDNIV